MTKKKKETKIKMSVPKGMEFNTPYSVDATGHRAYTDLLKEKNKAYGNTALNPTNIFSKLNATEAICARIDDKLARIGNKGINDETEDTVDDLIGYLLLLKMSI